MAQVDNDSAGTAGNTAVPAHGDRDRVAMLSLRADGTPDQHNPQIIGDKEFALEATRRQMAEQAVSAVDQRDRPASPLSGAGAEVVGQDPAVEKLQAGHRAAEQAAEKAAEKAVDALYKPAPASGPAGDSSGKPDAGKKPTRQ